MRRQIITLILLISLLSCCAAIFSGCNSSNDSSATAATTLAATTFAPTAIPTTTIPTTPAPTTAPPVRQEVYRITFDDIKVVTSHPNCDISLTADNTLMINVTKNDPNITIKLANPIATSDIDLIVVNAKSDTDDSPQMFYITDTNKNWSEGQSDKEMFMDPGGPDFENLEFDMTYTDGWDGNLTSIRFDPVAGGEGNIEVNYISFIKLVYDTTTAN